MKLKDKLQKFKEKIKSLGRSSTKKPLIEDKNINCDPTDRHSNGNLEFDNPHIQNTINSKQEQKDQRDGNATLQDLHELLDVSSLPAVFSEDDCHASDGPDQTPVQQSLKQCIIPIQSFWAQHFPKPPSDLEQSLFRHLSEVFDIVVFQLEKLEPALRAWGLMELMIQCCHRQTFDHMQALLQRVNSCSNYFGMINWVRGRYFSYEPLSRPDLWMFNEWETKVRDKLLEKVQGEVKMQLRNTLMQINRKHSDSDEDYVGFCVDIIQCTEAMPAEAGKISSDLSNQVREICFKELLPIVTRYAAQQKEILEKHAKSDKPETIQFLKTLKSCKEIRNYIHTKGAHIKNSLRQETVDTLEKLEAHTSKLLTGIVVGAAERTFKRYFKSHHRKFFPFADVEKHFPKLSYASNEHQTVMDDIYKAVAHAYLKNLLGTSLRKLRKSWSTEVERTITEDAQQLHEIISNLVPDIQQWNRLLLEIPEVLSSQSMDALKLTMASIQMDCKEQSDDLQLLPDLLRWKGLSKWDIKEVMEALPGTPPTYRFKSRSIFSCFFPWYY